MATIPPLALQVNCAPQTFTYPPAALPLPPPTITTIPALPITIDTLAYISEVYDSLFAPQVSGSTPLLKNIRTVLFKKLLLDHATQELIFRPILTFEDVISFTLDILHQMALLS